MMGVEGRRVLSLMGALLGVWLTVRFVIPLLLPFLLGLGLALAAEPGVGFLSRRLRLPRTLGAALSVTGIFFAICVLLTLLLSFLLRELGTLAGILPDMEVMAREGLGALQAWLLELTGRLPAGMCAPVQRNVKELFSGGTALLDRATRYALGLAGTMLSHVPDSALGLGTALLSAFLISAKLPAIAQLLRRSLSERRLKQARAWLHQLRRTAGAWLLAQCKLSGVTYGVLTAGFWLLRIPYGPLWALGIAAVDAFPILGTGTVLVPWGVVCLLRGDTGGAAGLLGLYALVTLLRTTLEPRLVGQQLGLDPLVTLMALYIGFRLWGLPGMIFAPLLAVMAVRTMGE